MAENDVDNELLDYEDDEVETAAGGDGAEAPAKKDVKGSYVSIHSSGFRDFLLKPELLRAIVDCGFEHPSEDMRRDVQEIFRMTPHEKQVMMFSATLSKVIRPVCRKFMQDVNTLYLLFLHSPPTASSPSVPASSRLPGPSSAKKGARAHLGVMTP